MRTESETVNGVFLDDANASYDKAAKRFLAEKVLLAWILIYLVEEFRECSLRDIAEKYIEGDPRLTVGTIPVDPDLTNAARKLKTKQLRRKSKVTATRTAAKRKAPLFSTSCFGRLSQQREKPSR